MAYQINLFTNFNLFFSFHHIYPVLYDLVWLQVQFRIIFKLLFYTFKTIHKLAPPYLSYLLHRDPSSWVEFPGIPFLPMYAIFLLYLFLNIDLKTYLFRFAYALRWCFSILMFLFSNLLCIFFFYIVYFIVNFVAVQCPWVSWKV